MAEASYDFESGDADFQVSAFVVDTEEKVNWVLRKIGNVEAERARIKAQYRDIMERLDCEEKALRGRFEADLMAFAAQRIEAQGGRRKSVKLLQGTLAFKTVPARLTLTDEQQARLFATTEGLASCFEERFNAAAYREIAEARAQETGELLPGVEAVPERESFSVRFGKSEEAE